MIGRNVTFKDMASPPLIHSGYQQRVSRGILVSGTHRGRLLLPCPLVALVAPCQGSARLVPSVGRRDLSPRLSPVSASTSRLAATHAV